MKLAVDRESALAALNRVVKVSPTNVANPVLTYAKVEAHEDELYVSATDLSTRIVAKVPGKLKVQEPGTCLVPAVKLALALRASKAPFLVLGASQDGTDVLGVIGQTTYQWKSLPPDHFPNILDLHTQAESHVLDRASFYRALQKVSSALPKMSDPRFDQIGIRDGLIQAADSARYHQVIFEDAALVDVALPSSFVTDVSSLLSSSSEEKITLGVSADKKALSVQVGPTILMTRSHAEPFPDVSQVFTAAKMSNQSRISVSRDDLLNAVRRVRTLADTESGAVLLTLEPPSKLVVSARQQSGSRAFEQITGENEFDRKLVVHHDHLVKLLTMFDVESIVDLMLGPDTKSKPSSIYATDGRHTGVIMQLRLGWHDAAA